MDLDAPSKASLTIKSNTQASSFKKTITDWLDARRFLTLSLAVCAVLLAPVFFLGFYADDYLHLAIFKGNLPIPEANQYSPFGLFSFLNDNQDRFEAIRNLSMVPWWTTETFQFSFWRPFSELTHWLDYSIAGAHSPVVAHIQNVLWYFLLLVLLFSIYRNVSGTTSQGSDQNSKKVLTLGAALPFLIYAFDSTHAFTVAWIANRNSIIATTFGLAALLCHIKYQSEGWKPGAKLGPLVLLLGLLSAEFAIATTGYLFAWSLFLDKRSTSVQGRVRALISLWPYALVTLAWLLTYKTLGFGAKGNDGYYVDPFESPVMFLASALERLPILFFSQFGIIPSEFYAPQIPLGSLHLKIAILFLVALSLLLSPLIRTNKQAQFWLTGMILSALPICATGPNDRLLLFVGVGASGLLGMLMNDFFRKAEWIESSLKFIKKFFIGFLFFCHLIISPIALPLFSYLPEVMLGQYKKIILDMPEEVVANKDVIILQSPIMISAYFMPIRFVADAPMPNQVWAITGEGELSAVKKDEYNLEINIEYPRGSTSYTMFRDTSKKPLLSGDQVALDGLTIKILDVSEELIPTKLELQFDSPIAASKSFLMWNGKGFQTIDFSNLSVGENLEL